MLATGVKQLSTYVRGDGKHAIFSGLLIHRMVSLSPTWILSPAIERIARDLSSSSRNLCTSRRANQARAARWICRAAASSRIARTRL